MSLQEAATTLSTSPGSEDQEYIPLTPHHLIFQPDISVDVTNHRNYPFLCIGVFIMTGVYKYDDFKGIYIHVYLYEDPIAILMIKNTPKNGTSKNSGTGKRSEWYTQLSTQSQCSKLFKLQLKILFFHTRKCMEKDLHDQNAKYPWFRMK